MLIKLARITMLIHYTCTHTYFFAFIPGAMLAALWRCEFTGGFTNRLGAGLRGGVRGGEQSSSCSALSRSSAMLSSTGRPPLPVDPTLSMGQAYDALLSLSSHEVPGIIVSQRIITFEYESWNYLSYFFLLFILK